MSDCQVLTFIRTLHTAIYLVMALSTFVLIDTGLTGA